MTSGLNNSLIKSLEPGALFAIAQEAAAQERSRTGPHFQFQFTTGSYLEEVGSQLDTTQVGILHGTSRGYWRAFKKEFRLLVCTDDPKYASLREDLGKSGAKTQMTIVSTVAAAIASAMGILAGALVPICALALFALARLGKEAYCGAEDPDIELRP